MKLRFRSIFKNSKMIATVFTVAAIVCIYAVRVAQADPVVYYFNNAVSQSGAELGNYWYDNGFSDPALELPNFSIDEVYVSGGIVFEGNITFNVNARNDGTVQGDAIFNGSAVNAGTVTGTAVFNDTSRNDLSAVVSGDASFHNDATNGGYLESDAFFYDSAITDTDGRIVGNITLYNDVSEAQGGARNSMVNGTLRRHYTVETTTNRDFTPWTRPEPYIGDGQQPWTVVADGVDVDVTGATFDITTVFLEINGGNFIFPLSNTYYFNNAVNTDPNQPGNYWLDEEATIAAGTVPNFLIDEVYILASGSPLTPTTFSGDAVFNGSATNKGIVTGDATFRDDTQNINDFILSSGVIQGDATFYDNSVNNGGVEGVLTMINDLSETNNRPEGNKIRKYTLDTTTTRNFISFGPWTVIADGVVVDVTGSTYDGTTRFEVLNGGSFIGAEVSAPRFYFFNPGETPASDLGNYWQDNACTIPAEALPDFENDEVNIVGQVCGEFIIVSPSVFDDDIIFNGGAVNDGIVTGNAIFRDFSMNSGVVEGNAEFVGDIADITDHEGTVEGTVTRRYVASIATVRNFETDGPWIVIADGAVVDVTGAAYKNTTVFQTVNGGSFVFPMPVLSTASISAKNIILRYDAALDEDYVPLPGDFSVTVNGLSTLVNSVSVSGQNVTISLDLVEPASTNEVVQLHYTPGVSPIQTAYGAEAAALNNQSVTVTSALSIGGSVGRSLAVGSKVYVISPGNTVKAIDSATQTDIATISVGAAPVFLAYVHDRVYVINQNGNSVSVINPSNNTVIATVAVGTAPISATVVGTKLYVNNSTSGTVSVLNALTNTVTATITVGSQPRSSAVVGSKLYVVNQGGSSVSVVDLSSDTVVATIGIGSTPRNPLVVGTKLYILQTNGISVINTLTDSLIATIALSGSNLQPSVVYGNKLYALNFATDSVDIINTLTDTVSSSINVGDGPTFSHIAGNRLYVSNQNSGGISVINLANDSVLATLIAGTSPQFLSSIGNILYASRPNDGYLSIINTSSISPLLPNLLSFSSTTPDGNYSTGQAVTITANFARALAAGSTMTVSLNTGASVVLNSVSGGSISGIYTIAAGESTPDLSVIAVTSAAVVDAEAHARSSYDIFSSPDYSNINEAFLTRNLGDQKNIIIGGYSGIAVGNYPQQVSAPITVNGSQYVYVSNSRSNSVSAIEVGSAVAGSTISVGNDPYGVVGVYVAGQPYLYVANSGSNTVSVIDAAARNIFATIAVGVRPRFLSVVGTKVYAINSDSNSVSVINSLTNTVSATIPVGLSPMGAVFFENRLYVANYGNANLNGGNSISVIDTDTDALVETIVLPAAANGPYGIAIHDRNLYISNYRSNTVVVIDIDTGALESTISVPGGPRDIAVASNSIYVQAADSGTIWVIDSNSRLETAIVFAGHTPSGFSAVGNKLYYARSKDNVVSLFDFSNNTVSSQISTTGSSTNGGGGGGGGGSSTPTTPPVTPTEPTIPSDPATPPANPDSEIDPPAKGPTDQNLVNRLKGRLLLAVEDRGKIWYLDTVDGLRYRVTLTNALALFRRLSLGITNANLSRIPLAPSQSPLSALGNRLKGKLLLQVENRGVIWYVDVNGQRHLVTATNLLDVFKALSLGITNDNLDKLPVGNLN